MKQLSAFAVTLGQWRLLPRPLSCSIKFNCLLAATVIVLVVFITVGWAAEEGNDHGGGLGSLAWSIGNFAVLVYILYHFGGKRIYTYLKKRQEKIRSTLEMAEKARNEAEEKARLYREKLEAVEEEIQRIIAEMREEGEAEKNRIIESAQQAAQRIKIEARRAADEEVNRAAALLREEMVSLSVQLAEELVRRNLTPEDQHRLIRRYLDQIAELS